MGFRFRKTGGKGIFESKSQFARRKAREAGIASFGTARALKKPTVKVLRRVGARSFRTGQRIVARPGSGGRGRKVRRAKGVKISLVGRRGRVGFGGFF